MDDPESGGGPERQRENLRSGEQTPVFHRVLRVVGLGDLLSGGKYLYWATVLCAIALGWAIIYAFWEVAIGGRLGAFWTSVVLAGLCLSVFVTRRFPVWYAHYRAEVARGRTEKEMANQALRLQTELLQRARDKAREQQFFKQQGSASASPVVKQKSLGGAFVLEFLIPGAGFLYLGQMPFVVIGACLLLFALWEFMSATTMTMEGWEFVFVFSAFRGFLAMLAANHVNKKG